MPLRLRGLMAWVSCEEKVLSLYQVRKENDNLMTCYIPSQAGKTFVVHYASEGYKGDILARVFVDGRKADAALRRAARLPNGNGKFRGVHHDGVLRPFVFASVQTHDDHGDTATHDVSQLGTLELKLYRTVIGPAVERVGHDKATFQAFGSVSEKTKLAGFHCTTLGESVVVPPVAVSNHNPSDWTKPYVIFRFCYLPQELLQARGIIPSNHKEKAKSGQQPDNNAKKRAEPPEKDGDSHAKRQRVTSEVKMKTEPTEGSISDHASSSDAERIRLLEQALKVSQDALGNVQAELQNLKSKQRGPSSSACKIERRPSPIRLGPYNGEVIDLTED